MKTLRTLRAEEVEVRVQSVKDGKANMLLYIDSRCVTNILDEHFGVFGWQTEFYEVNGQTMGKLGLWDEEKKMWVWKSDTGSESNIEAEKGLISDIYKRLLSRIGYTELYSSPKIQIEDDKYGNSGYKVTEITYDENRKITHLVIVNRFGKEAFRWDMGVASQPTQFVPKKAHIQTTKEELEWKEDEDKKDNLAQLTEFCTQMKNNGHNKNELKKFYDYYSGKMNSWRNALNLEKLWTNWISRAAA